MQCASVAVYPRLIKKLYLSYAFAGTIDTPLLRARIEYFACEIELDNQTLLLILQREGHLLFSQLDLFSLKV
jgi:hypothetical protein